MQVVLKHLRFAKQRFDSVADPMAKVAFMLLPLGTLLAFIGSDERHKPDMRARALKLLKKLDSKFALAIGLSADWGIVTQASLRLFDKTSHDIAKTHAEIDAFKTTLRVLWEEGAVFYRRDFPGIDGQPSAAARVSKSRLPAIGGYLGSEGVRPAFVTQSVGAPFGAEWCSIVAMSRLYSGALLRPRM